MIKLEKRPDAPDSLKSQVVINKVIALRKIVESGSKPGSKDYSNYWQKSREILYVHQKNKCCYCERIRELKRESDLEHFRPKAFVADEPSHMGYWWLAYNFNNYLYSCKICNEDHKKNHFPLIDSSTRAFLETDNIKDEVHYLIDPYKENPEEFLGYFWDDYNSQRVKVISKMTDSDKRGEKTAKIAGLNRDSLMLERAKLLIAWEGLVTAMQYAILRDSKDLIEKSHKFILSETSSKRAFTGFRRYFFTHHGLKKYISTD